MLSRVKTFRSLGTTVNLKIAAIDDALGSPKRVQTR